MGRGSERPIRSRKDQWSERFSGLSRQAVPTGEAHRLPKVPRVYRRGPGVSRPKGPELLRFSTLPLTCTGSKARTILPRASFS